MPSTQGSPNQSRPELLNKPREGHLGEEGGQQSPGRETVYIHGTLQNKCFLCEYVKTCTCRRPDFSFGFGPQNMASLGVTACLGKVQKLTSGSRHSYPLHRTTQSFF